MMFADMKIETLKSILIVVFVMAFIAVVRIWKDEKNHSKHLQRLNNSNVSALSNTKNQLTVEASNSMQKDDSIAKLSAKLLGVKPKNIIQYKYIETKGEIKGDTFYELEEVEIPIGTKFKYKFNECAEVEMEWGTPAKWKLNQSNTITDVTYFNRRHLFGVEKLPRIGKKEYYQTLLTKCNDTLINNRLITFTKQ